MRRSVAAVVVVLAAPVVASAASPPIPPPPTQHSPNLPSDVPFDSSRGPFAPLYFSIDGLWSGKAQVGAGTRPFGVCWQGGVAPYEVRLTDSSGAQVFDRTQLSASPLVLKGADAVNLALGDYSLALTDDRGIERDERFTVVDASKLPAGPANAVGRATSLAGVPDGAFAFEAYLELLQTPATNADAALAARLCHLASG
jgi:hypothetical protein